VTAHVVPGEANHAVTGELEVGVGVGVTLEVSAGAVVGVAVELYDETVGRPERVYFVEVALALEEDVLAGQGEHVGLEKILKSVLQLFAGVAGFPGGDGFSVTIAARSRRVRGALVRGIASMTVRSAGSSRRER
jgi:hypothetical protein